ncbi:zinc-binding dehydrogenase [Caldifermentibacillus hisashii]|uniref:zinc-binding dehydrogenase n=1 Tax=Bacillaceae TaxID=186817 RepID=UPI001D0862C0|nr:MULTISPECIES: zinc-binding dehydrogenase [Caldibacillus]MCB7070729.1 zinc-binding dehydrogenase [Caldibacillus sp. 210928-DFI.2.22]MCB7074273.1 zinc-binding dehydrogenase [Caldibacillus sp. 210928-DFI.2.18]MCM3799348.1 zinc-binding dehydrogenase [Caldibacillus thermoamylovorans]
MPDRLIGLLTLLVAKRAGATETFVVDVSPERLEKAKSLGVTYVINPVEENAVIIIAKKIIKKSQTLKKEHNLFYTKDCRWK